MSAESTNSAIQRNQVDLAGFVDWSGVECLNQNSSHSVPNALKQGYRDDDGLHLESDADEQLLLYIPFTQVVKLYAIDIKGPDDHGPKTVKLFSNKEHMGFSNVNDYPPSDTATLTPENLKGKPVILKYVKFQNVRSLTIFIKDNQAGSEITKIQKIELYGTTVRLARETGSMNCTKREWPFSVARANMPCKNHNDEDDGMNDPDYAKFLKSAKAVKDCYISENVTVVRNYYKLDFVKKVRGVETITYEVEELSSDIRFQGSGPKSCRKSADCDRGGSLKTPSRGWGESEFGFMDHSYKTLLDVVELVGESLVLKTSGGLVEFEKQSSTDPLYRAGSDSCKRKNSMSHQQGKIKVTGLHHVLGGSSTKRRKVYSEGQNYRTKLRSNILNVGEALFTARKEKENTSQHIAHVTSGFVQELNLEVNRSSAPKSKGRNHIACEMVEQDFKLFLDGAILREGLLVYKMYDGEEIVLEEDSDSSSIIVTDNADALTDGKSNPFVTTKHYYSLKRSKKNSDFQRMLIKTLRKPYDSREHKKLLREASRRKPVVYHKELRSRAYYPVVEVLGKSYFDHHRGLEGRFNSVRKDHRKGLNLLRGFFYWLKNLNQEGSFKPWTDKVCLQIMPRE